jgi:lactate dehydrogenase-like 2-hydroxyacid dehydrogenase
MKPRIFVTRRWPAAVEARLTERFDTVLNTGDKPLSLKELRAALSSFDAVLPTVTDTLSSEAMNVQKLRTKILANYGVGYSHIDAETAARHNITVTNTPDVLSQCTADLAMTLLLMVARRAAEGAREIRDNAWTGWRPTHLVGTKVSGKTLGVIGYGRIGQEMAKRAHHGFGMKIIVQNRSPVAADVLAKCNATQVDSIEDLMPLCDFVSLHCPGGAANRHMIRSAQLELMKPDAFLINTARGEIINEHDLAQALWFETIGGAALDVFDVEPHISSKLRDCENLVMLPHLGSATRETREAMGFRVVDNLMDFFSGLPPRDRVL